MKPVGRVLLALALLLGSLLGCGAGPAPAAVGTHAPSPGHAAGDTAEARDDLSDAERSTIAIFRSAAPSVVHITRMAVRQDFFSRNVSTVPEGTGSGVIWDASGHVVTNFHVIRGAGGARVTLQDGSVWPARLVGQHGAKDLAVLHIEAPAESLRPLPVGTSRDLLVGQHVLAIGNPFGLDHTLSTGVISGLGREIMSATRRPIQDVIQTDAAINPGNSGGPLLDSRGRLIGINTAIYSPSGASAGIGFAVPVDTVVRDVAQLIAHGRVARAGIGVRVDESGFSRRLGVSGILIVQVRSGSIAERAGLRATRRDSQTGRILIGDVIVSLDGEPIRSAVDFHRLLDQRQVGHQARLGVLRGNERLEVRLPLVAEVDE